jgi:hypothetical protein
MAVVRWQAWNGCEEGIEHCEIRPDGDDILVTGMIIGRNEGEPFGLDYRLVVDGAWRLREAALRTAAGRTLHLTSDGAGLWTVDGHADPALAHCTDLDIEATPLTNTLPIRRLALGAGQAAAIDLAYVSVPSLAVAPARQRYTALEPGRLYRFESLESGFTADLPVDPDGLVLDYPGLFRRLP